MVKINNDEQRALFEIIAENLNEDELETVVNWGSELYNDGMIVGGLSVGLGVLIYVVSHHLFKKFKKKKGDKNV